MLLEEEGVSCYENGQQEQKPDHIEYKYIVKSRHVMISPNDTDQW